MKEKASKKSIKQLKYQFFVQYKNEWKEILIVISDKLKHSHKGFKCFIGYKDVNIVR